jgi:hypothetical protein
MKKIGLAAALICSIFSGQAQNKQVVPDFDAQGRYVAKILPFELATAGDTTLMLEARYGYENNQERFRFIFTVNHKGSMFYKTSEHTTVTFIGENGKGTLKNFEDLKFETDKLDYHFIFTAGDLGYEDNDISLQKMGGISSVILHELPEMDMVFILDEEQYAFLKDIQNSLRIAYRTGYNPGGSAIKFGNEKSDRNSKSNKSRGDRLKL